ncbi:uncharacterized protein LOC131536537 isoform X1 [Onychostoma macrolepis]|uniref:uncharacterized protein LOC131536537 isoform X1 n=1 Tax=Onychostoma macrolepis TaxID=369639 RepID=UPI00272C01D1|nr:uncharacterized protein LOC131536537 isoform X1 [Onychostoma macrolepis]XP_058625521.1 uncharacterized protein LOC131536537 isoform X1 [Onychostoma macrolepis]XP_058625523.1 uncharacterized protein LOC131536537 isoform X1 [Onychostoma macrolepis]
MADECDLCLLGLIFLSSLLSGSSEVDVTHVFISSGQNVRLSCNNALHDCKSTYWIYNRFSHSAAVELINSGIKKKDTERHERLSLGSDCSLNINNITEEDYGLYTCRQYVNKQQQGTDARVFLHVLHVSSSSSSSQTEISAGRSVTLFCQLYSDAGVSCDDWIRSEGIELFWVNQAGVKLKISDSRYQISASDHCNITLTTTLLNEDHNREWRCSVTHRDRVQSSVTYTVKSSARDDPASPVIPVHNTKSTTTTPITSTQESEYSLNTPNSESTAAAQTPVFTEQQVTSATATTLNPDTAPISLKEVIVIVVGASFALLILALIIWLIHKKRAGVRRATHDSVEQTDDLTYIVYCVQ